MRRAVIVVLSLLAVSLATPSQAAPPRLERQLMIFSYDGYGPALLNVEGEVQAKGRPGYFASVTADLFQGELTPFFPDVIELGDDGAPVRTYGAIGDRDICASPVVSCAPAVSMDSLSFSSSFSVGKSRTPVHLRMIIAMEGTHVEASHLELGWKTQIRRGGFSRATSGGSGARALGTSVEAMPEATLRGGARGSIAIGVPPCEDLGAGAVTLSGGTKDQTAVCPSYAFAAAAKKATTWTLTGAAAGSTAYRTRLIDIDL
jgi:hypothetical protein